MQDTIKLAELHQALLNCEVMLESFKEHREDIIEEINTILHDHPYLEKSYLSVNKTWVPLH